jgi:hypothetical protein
MRQEDNAHFTSSELQPITMNQEQFGALFKVSYFKKGMLICLQYRLKKPA